MKDPFYQSPFFLSFTIGVPFCIFKILFGILSIRVGTSDENQILTLFGTIVIIWASADLIMNIARAAMDYQGILGILEFCTLAQAGRVVKAPLVFLALDTVITFLIICFVLWSGWIIHLSKLESYLWYFATTLNLISLSLVGLWTEFLRYQKENHQ